ncbi:hypothetical protein [Mesorhizobium sp.]|uniref:hypothetical protein n=1 Tax=Mesorhizobium sp. TaxID=1871066 RepID=UPI00121549E7|nr:hypothetical protein [Mesorhizobium sp.]TIO36535.1 MAG: hypothetical protein E5X89_00525 [Mesorhizobium sp.]
MAIDGEFLLSRFQRIGDEHAELVRIACAMAEIDDREDRLFRRLMIAEASNRIADLWQEVAAHVTDGGAGVDA